MPETSPSRGPIRGVAHVTLPVGDLAVAEAFYVGLLGAKLLRRCDRETFLRSRPERADEADAANSPLHLEITFGTDTEFHLFLQRGGQPTAAQGHPHYALWVAPQDLLAFRDALAARGVPTDGPRRLGPPGHASLYFFDPFGNHLELATMGFEGDAPIGPPQTAALPYHWKG